MHLYDHVEPIMIQWSVHVCKQFTDLLSFNVEAGQSPQMLIVPVLATVD